MKSHGRLIEHYANFDALHDAYRQARRRKCQTRGCMRFELRLEENLIDLQNRLLWGEYRIGPYRHFYVSEPKRRRITALENFEDRVVQHALYAALSPLWERRFISDSYACRVGKGSHAAAGRAQSMLRDLLRRQGQIYVLKADIAKYFGSIDHGATKRLIRRAVRCPATLALLDNIIDSYHEPGQPGKGIPIGNLVSQLLANVYLNELDQHVKCRRSERYYVRYMDDFVVMHHDKRHLHALRIDLERWLADTLALETNHKTSVFPVHPRHGRGLDFVGYHLWPHTRRLRKGSMKRFKRRVRKLRRWVAEGDITLDQARQQMSSWLAHARHANAEGFVRSVIYDQPWELPKCPSSSNRSPPPMSLLLNSTSRQDRVA